MAMLKKVGFYVLVGLVAILVYKKVTVLSTYINMIPGFGP
jgi:hypothetical protein